VAKTAAKTRAAGVDSAQPGGRFLPLDGLRGLAAIGVLSFHVVVWPTADFPQLDSLYLFVDFFFVLSGFVLWPSMPSREAGLARSTGAFVVKRVFRFWPLVIVSLIFATFLLQLEYDFLTAHDQWDPPFGYVSGMSGLHKFGIFASAYLLLQIFVYPAMAMNVPLWSLSAEWFANLIYAPLAWLKYSLGIVALIVVGYGMLSWGLINDQSFIDGSGPIRGWEALGRALLGFGIGLLLRKHLSQLARFRTWWLLVISLALVAMLPFIEKETHWDSYRYAITLYAAPIFALLILQISRFEANPQGRWGKFLAFLGAYSFGIYVFHQPMIQAWNVILGTPAGGKYNEDWIWFFLTQASTITFLCILLTFIARKVVEAPLQRWGKKLVGRIEAGAKQR
jgi:peptidoglycan/LPS O-acetylase OafA/YrhL